MPNIIEQQDLLKGLPDNRLAMLLQQPVGDIPPFLVAAEAQRRQAIRQQFASEGSKESVVDSLTKQLARVPQNLNAPPQTPPMVPPTPEMAGVAALQQQQQMEQAAQNMMPQQMRSGGMVRRFNSAFGSFVAPVVPPTSSRVKEIADQFGITVEEAAQMMKNNPDVGGGKPEDQFGTPPQIMETNQEPPAPAMTLDLPSINISAEEYNRKQKEQRREDKYNEMDNYGGYTGKSPIGAKELSADEIAGENQRLLQRLNDQKKAAAAEAAGPSSGETEDEFRARIEALYSSNEPSDWEKSQRWFAMAEQFLDPEKTTMQSVAGAGRAFADQSAAMAAAERQASRERDKAMLEYDMSQRDYERQQASSQSTQAIESIKYQSDQALREAELYRKAADDAKSELADYEANNMFSSADSAAGDSRATELRERVRMANEALNTAVNRARYYQKLYGDIYGTYGVPGQWDGNTVKWG